LVLLVDQGASAASPYQLKESPYSSHALLLAQLPAPGEGRRVLDAGCGPGYLSGILSARGYRVTALERAGAPQLPVDAEFLQWDLDQGLPELGIRYDYVLCADILEHLRDPAMLLREIRAVLAPGGAVLASLPNSGHAYVRWNVLRGRFPQHDRGLFDRTHLHFYTWDGWVELFRSAGLRVEARAASGVPVSLALPRWHGSRLVEALERASYDLARVWKTVFAYQFIVTARP
jgi:SAM-dependent methyltransferase